MPFRWNVREHAALGAYVLKWILIVSPLGLAVGSLCAFFLWSLDWATRTQHQHHALLYFLPIAGIAIAVMYQRLGREAEAGNNLIMDEIHEAGGGVPARMAPLVLIGTILTHLFGGSAGREGTAVQMGGSIAGAYARLIRRIHPADVRTLLMAGVAAGFGGVFGTPLAGAIFALEVISIGRMSYEAVIPCLIAGIVSDWSCSAWGTHHTDYHNVALLGTSTLSRFDGWLMGKVVIASAAFGLASVFFAELTHGLHRMFRLLVRWAWARPLIGGLLIIGMTYLLGTREYLGLGLTSPVESDVTILSSFHPDGAGPLSWLYKTLFTAVTLSSGFKGGEVTPLFFIGASLGNAIGTVLNAPIPLFAALGFIAVFSGATNTPLACTIMAIELFGPVYVMHFAVASFLAYMFSGHSGIYLSQRIGVQKAEAPDLPPDVSLRLARELRGPPAPSISPRDQSGRRTVRPKSHLD